MADPGGENVAGAAGAAAGAAGGQTAGGSGSSRLLSSLSLDEAQKAYATA